MSSLSELKRLATVEGGYQPILINEEPVTEGWRECYNRWEAIKPHLDSRDGLTVVDIGSHYGYFTVQAARANMRRNFVWSVEGGPRRADIQQKVLEANELSNVVLSEHMFRVDMASKLFSSCFTADVILMLSVAHYFTPDELAQLMPLVAGLSPVLIIEYPSKDEKEVAARDNVQQVDIVPLLEKYYEKVELIGGGRSPKHTDVDRPIYKASNPKIIRDNCKSYIGNEVGKKHQVLYGNGQWYIDGRVRAYPGITLENLRHFGMSYPQVIHTLEDAADRYTKLIKKRRGRVTDINIRNVLTTPKGLVLIDFTEGLEHKTIYDIPLDDYIAKVRKVRSDQWFGEFQRMWEGTWSP